MKGSFRWIIFALFWASFMFVLMDILYVWNEPTYSTSKYIIKFSIWLIGGILVAITTRWQYKKRPSKKS